MCFSGTSQIQRPHFHTPLHPWITETKSFSLHDTKSMVPHAHSGWVNPFTKSLSHPSPTAPLSVHPSTSLVASNSFSFPPTPPKDGTPENVQGHSEYTPDNKPKQMDGSEGFSSFHPVPTYPYMTAGDYPSNHIGFHPSASVFKTASLSSRSRTKSRSSTGKLVFYLYK